MSGVKIFLRVVTFLSLVRVYGQMTNLVQRQEPTITPGQQASQAVVNGIIAAFAIGLLHELE